MSQTPLKDRAATVYTVVEAVVLAMSVCMLAWTSAKLVTIGELVSMHGNQIVDLQRRTEKVESAALLSATIPGKLDGISARMELITESQRRTESVINEMKDKKTP